LLLTDRRFAPTLALGRFLTDIARAGRAPLAAGFLWELGVMSDRIECARCRFVGFCAPLESLAKTAPGHSIQAM